MTSFLEVAQKWKQRLFIKNTGLCKPDNGKYRVWRLPGAARLSEEVQASESSLSKRRP